MTAGQDSVSEQLGSVILYQLLQSQVSGTQLEVSAGQLAHHKGEVPGCLPPGQNDRCK